MSAAVSWASRVKGYLIYRRRHGFNLSCDETQLTSFARFADQLGTAEYLSVALAIEWAQRSNRRSSLTWGRRIDVLRGFARYCQLLDPRTEVPPQGLFGPTHRRLVPHIYTEPELIELLESAKGLAPSGGMRPATCSCIFGLLASCGLRIAEALALSRNDVDLDAGVLHIRDAKFHQQRLVPLHPSVCNELRAYDRLRRACFQSALCDLFFVRDDGQAVNQASVRYALQTLCKQLGWKPRGDYPNHRLHDLRHTFIVHATLRFYQQGIDIDRAVLALSTYVGHAKVTDTYWYFTGIPELMAIAAERFECYAEGAPQ